MKEEWSEKRKSRLAKHRKRAGRPTHYTPDVLKKLEKELLEFVALPDCWHISKFEIAKGHRDGWLYDIAQRHPIFQGALNTAKKILGNKIIERAQEGGGNNWLTKRLTKMYMQDIHDAEEAEKDLQLERDKKLATHKANLGSDRDEKMIAKIEKFDEGIKAADENKRLLNKLKAMGIDPFGENDS
jgi:hypothetical protein